MNGIEKEFILITANNMKFNDDEIRWEELFVQGSKNRCTTDRADKSKPLVLRGITKRKQVAQCLQENRTFYYMDTGYFGNFPSEGNKAGLKKYHRIVKNELQNTTIKEFPSDRWNKLVKDDSKLKWRGWKTKGKKILLVIPNGKSCVYYKYDLESWKNQTIETIRRYTNMPIEIREKESRRHRNTVHSIYDAFDEGVFATVSFNSIAAIESIVYGIPAFITVPCAASPLASTDLSKISTPFYPDEDLVLQQCYNLAYSQFTADEIANGFAWNILNR